MTHAPHRAQHYVRSEPIEAGGQTPRITVHQRRPTRRWVLSIVLVAFVATLLLAAAFNDNLRWSVVWTYFVSPPILHGLLVTLELSVIAMVIGIVLGVLLALAARSPVLVLRWFAAGYIWLFRGVPLLVQLLFWFNIGILVPRISFDIPLTNLWFDMSANAVISGFTASIMGLGLNEGAYMAEIVRAGLIAVPTGQRDAALSIGMSPGRAMRYIVLPQTIRVVIPPTGNEFIGLVKSSAMVAVIGGGDLLYRAQIIYGQNFEVIPLLLVASIWYLVITSIATLLQAHVEKRLSDDVYRPARIRGQRSRWFSAGRGGG